MKSFWRFAMVSAIAAMLAACDSDSGTSASDSNAASQESSSSSVDPESTQGDDTKSDKSSSNSSGVILSSSSAEKVDPESTQGGDDSSSSIDAKGDVSSSSTSLVVYSSSGNVIIEFGSSSSTVNSSSSATANNSSNSCIVDGSITVMYNFVYECIGGEWTLVVYDAINGQLTYDTLFDPRDNQRYLTLEITGWDSNATAVTLTYMAQNLNYGTMTLGANEQDDDNTVEKYCYSDTAWYCEQFGGLYQWAEMMNLPYECNTQSCADQIDPDGDGFHQGICPDGWHLMNYYEASAVSNEYSYAGMKAMVLWSNAQGTNNSGFSAVGAGWRTNKNIFDALFNEARFAYPVEDDKPEWTADGCYYGVLAKISTSSSLYDHGYKAAGNSVRCVKNY